MSSDIYQRLREKKAALDTGARRRKPKNTGSHWRQYKPLAQSEDVQQPEPIMTTQETTELCQRTKGCSRARSHTGRCATLTREQQVERRNQRQNDLRAKKKAAQNGNSHAPVVREVLAATAVALVLAEPTVTGFRFRLEIEEVFSDGEKTVYQTGGTSREKFKKVIDAAASLLNLE